METLAAFFVLGAIELLMTSPRLVRVGGSFVLGLASASGMPSLVLGLLLGPGGVGALPASKVAALQPLLTLMLTAAGLLFALNLRREFLRKVSFRIYLGAFAQALVTLLLVAAPLVVLLSIVSRGGILAAAGASTLAGAAACISAPHLPLLWQRWGKLPRLESLSLVVVATLDDFVGVAALAGALVFGAAKSLNSGAFILGVSILAGCLGALLITFLAMSVRGGGDLVAIVLGGIALIAGSCSYLRLSSIIASITCGIGLLLLSPRLAGTVHGILSRAERPIFVILLFLIGLEANLRSPTVWIAALAVIAMRVLGKVVGARATRTIAKADLVLPPRPGLALIAYGPLALCITADYALFIAGQNAHWLLDVAALAALGSEVIAATVRPQGASHASVT